MSEREDVEDEVTERDVDLIIEVAHPSRPDRAELVRHHLERIIATRVAARLTPVRALAEEMGGDDCECERYWTRRLARVLPPERLAGEAGSE